MSRSSFPRPEHASLLFDKISERLRSRRPPLELASRGLDHYRCCYRFGVRRPGDSQWKELAIHFQVAERLEADAFGEEVLQIVERFLERNFPAPEQERP